MIERDLEAAEEVRHDLIVVGGGIYGVSVALESVARGLRPLLLERADFGGATSASTLRILHGGLRYLQSLDLKRFRRSVRQRRWWLRTFPELVRPMPCLMPLDGRGLHRPWVLRAALAANDLLSVDRNRGVRADRRIPSGRVLDREETLDLFPGGPADRVEGGAFWHDATMDRPHRLIMEMLRWMVAGGGRALNYVAARQLCTDGDRIHGLMAVDGPTGRELRLRAPVVVNAAGPWSREVAGLLDRDRPELFRPSLAFNLLLRGQLPARVTVGVTPPRPESRTYFLRPAGRHIFAGTCHVPWSARSPDAPEPTAPQIDRFLADLNAAVPALSLVRDDVIRVFAGLLPATAAGDVEVRHRPVIVDHAAEGGPEGLFSVSGVKFTTAPAVAREVLEGIAVLPCVGARASTADWGLMDELRPPVRPVPAADALVEIDEGHAGSETIERVQVIAREESAMSADDLVQRRLDWSLEVEDLSRATRVLSRYLPELPLRGPEGSPAG